MSKGKSRPKFRYLERTYEDVQQQLQIAGLKDAIYAAYKGDAKALLDFLRSDLSLTHLEGHRQELADLIERQVQHKGRGKRGPSVPTRTGDVEQYFIALCRSDLERLRERYGGKLPKGPIDAVIEHWGGRLAEDGELIVGSKKRVVIVDNIKREVLDFINLEVDQDKIKKFKQALYPSRARTKKK